ncbi:hypothetical protein MMC12_000352 [Toensbergia leucococca]|nr:hypothetical protein [Toensbergia leucococca]
MTSILLSAEEMFSIEETQSLLEDQIFLSSCVLGKRKVSAALLSPPSSNTSRSSSSSTSASVRTLGFPSTSNHSFEIPTAERSIAALEFIGFDTLTATAIYDRWDSRPDPHRCPDDLIDYAYSDISRLNSPSFQDYTPREAMAKIGMSQDFQDALTDPRFTSICGTETLHYWVKDTLMINYATLLQLQARLKNHAARSRAVKKSRRARIQDIIQAPGLHAAQQQLQPSSSVTATFNMTPEDYNIPSNQIAFETEGPVLPGHIVLYKGKASYEVGEGWIADDGSLNMRSIATYAHGDFNPESVAYYWTPEKEVAEEYREWAARRCSWSETWLIRIQIPVQFVNSLTSQELWYSPNWKEYVWYCRGVKTLPAKFDSLWATGETDIIKGHICSYLSAQVTRIKQENVQTTMTEDFAMKIGSSGRKATQWAFMQRNSVERLREQIRGKIHIDITAATMAQGGFQK